MSDTTDTTSTADAVSTSRYGSRKFLACVGAAVLATFSLGMHWLSGSEWVTVMVADLGGYFTANVVQKTVTS